MSGVRRFLSRRDKSPHIHTHHSHSHHNKHEPIKTPKPPDHFHGVFTRPHLNSERKPDKEEEKKIKAILERLRHYGIDNITESNVEYALHTQSSQGDPEAAFRLLMLLEDTYEGIVRPFTPDTKLLGAVNKEGVTCYLDALLFAMFARLDSFEAIVFDNLEDAKRKRLAGLLRLWVNMLRTGRLITTDITEHLTNALADCGWLDAANLRQQDPSEAFTFITGQLELPMLTLKMDMYHTGKEDPQDDHKFVNERLLEVAILDEPPEGQSVITLEDCLEHYFNNRIEVKRHLENQRRNTLKSAQVVDMPTKVEKEPGTHVEVLEVPETPIAQSPAIMTPLGETPTQSSIPLAQQVLTRPTSGRKRADSIFSQRKVEVLDGVDVDIKSDDPNALVQIDSKIRKMSTRTEVLMPAWQFFKLLPWYTDNMPTSDAQVAAHFSKKRPVLGIALKRYSYTNTGQARKLDTYVDIPLEIAVPNFVSDEHMDEEGPLVGNFRLMLQSVVCHRGVSVHSGHYICLCRGRAADTQQIVNPINERKGSDDSDEDIEDPWMRFDDLAKERVTNVDIREALRTEMPYLLFYQVQPIGDDGHSIHDLPSYTEATSRSQSDAAPLEKPYLQEPPESENALNPVASEPAAAIHQRPSPEVTDWGAASERTSMDTGAMLEPTRGRSNGNGKSEGETRRKSIALDTSSFGTSTTASLRTDTQASNSVPSTPSEEKGNAFLSVANKINAASRRGSRGNKSNGGSIRSRSTNTDTSNNGNNRFSLNMTKLTQRISKQDSSSNVTQTGPPTTAPTLDKDGVPIIQPSEHVAAELAGETDVSAPSASVVDKSSSSEVVLPTHTDSTRSKENVTSSKAVPVPAPKAMGKKDKDKAKANAKRKGVKQEDRDCVVM